ncbi:hypothetical protein ACHWQZ_G015953 [Mnemiopsis leidyi]
MLRQKSRLVATYSKRKQFRRIVKDNWLETENVFSTSRCQQIQQPLTSTPIGKVKKPAEATRHALASSPEPLPDDRYPLKEISHPRQVSGKRACRRPPILNLTPEPQQNLIDYSADLFDSPAKAKSNKALGTLEPVLPTSDDVQMAESPKHVKEKASEEQKNLSPVPFSLVHSEYSSQFVEKDSKKLQLQEGSETSALLTQDEGPSTSIMEVSTNYSPVEMSESNKLSLELSKMSVKEGSPVNMSCLNESASTTNLSCEKRDEQKSHEKMEQSLEMSIEEAVRDEKIAVLDRSLMLATTIPSYTKLLSQCRRVKDLYTLIRSDLNCIKKIGEGSFGEVFMGQDTVYKIVPVGGEVEINDVEQTSFENAFQEIAVSRKLSDLAGDQVQMGKAFCQLKDVVFCKGAYPDVLLKAWDNFKGTENQRPDILPADQMYVVLLCKYSGVQLEEYCATHKLTPDQAHSVIRQICCSLAAAEQRYEFEHRDLHWGNVLIAETEMEHVEFTQDGKTYILRSHGLLATIIDFTFSRLETEGCLNYVDLEQEDWLFQGDAKADIQFRVYRDMRAACRKNWAKFTPKTNLLWLLYLIDKMNIKIRSMKLRKLKQLLSSCKSASIALPIAFRSL